MIKKLNEKSEKYNSESAIQHFRTFESRDKEKIPKYIKKLEDYEKRLLREERELHEWNLYNAGVKYDITIMTDS
jgi:hypothetical protein